MALPPRRPYVVEEAAHAHAGTVPDDWPKSRRLRALLISGEAVTVAGTMESIGGGSTLLPMSVAALEAYGYRVERTRAERGPGDSTPGHKGLTYRVLNPHHSPGPDPRAAGNGSAKAEPITWGSGAAVERAAADNGSAKAEPKRPASTSTFPPTPPLGALLRVVGLVAEDSGEIALVLSDVDARRWFAVLHGDAPSRP